MWQLPRAPAALWGTPGRWCDLFGRGFLRESIFKISHTKSAQKVQNLDPRSDVARTCLHLARRVHEGEERAPKAERANGRLGRMSGLRPGRLSRRSESCQPIHPIHTAPLLSSSLRSAGGSAASGASLTRSTRRPRPEGERAATQGAGDSVLDPEGWALWVTGLCLPLYHSLWGSALGRGSRRSRSQRLLLGRLGAVWDPLRRLPPAADGALGNSEGESGWGPGRNGESRRAAGSAGPGI